jgi:hypothetical protein
MYCHEMQDKHIQRNERAIQCRFYQKNARIQGRLAAQNEMRVLFAELN